MPTQNSKPSATRISQKPTLANLFAENTVLEREKKKTQVMIMVVGAIIITLLNRLCAKIFATAKISSSSSLHKKTPIKTALSFLGTAA